MDVLLRLFQNLVRPAATRSSPSEGEERAGRGVVGFRGRCAIVLVRSHALPTSSPRPSPPSDGGEGEIPPATGVLKEPLLSANSTLRPICSPPPHPLHFRPRSLTAASFLRPQAGEPVSRKISGTGRRTAGNCAFRPLSRPSPSANLVGHWKGDPPEPSCTAR